LLHAQDHELSILTENYPSLSFEEDGVVSGYGADVVIAIQKILGTDLTYPQLAQEAGISPSLLKPVLELMLPFFTWLFQSIAIPTSSMPGAVLSKTAGVGRTGDHQSPLGDTLIWTIV